MYWWILRDLNTRPALIMPSHTLWFFSKLKKVPQLRNPKGGS
jgi:hypothetical protein